MKEIMNIILALLAITIDVILVIVPLEDIRTLLATYISSVIGWSIFLVLAIVWISILVF